MRLPRSQAGHGPEQLNVDFKAEGFAGQAQLGNGRAAHPMGQRGDVLLHLPTLLGRRRRRRVAQLPGCSQVLRCSEMLKHFFDTEQRPWGISLSSVSVLHAG